jgi:ribosome-binding ATPase YchF (GTP1/OBG family)
MEVGIVGLPASGKTTLFNALTGAHAEAFGEKAHVGVAEIPDPNLAVIASFIPPEKIVHGTLRLVDIPGVPPGSDPKKLNTFLEQIRQVEAICLVVRCFDDGAGKIDPTGDIADMETELVLADLIVAEGARDRTTKSARAGHKDAKARLALLEKIIPVLEDGKVIRSTEDLSDAERVIVKTYGFVSAKPVLYVANVAEDDLTGESEPARMVYDYAKREGAGPWRYVLSSSRNWWSWRRRTAPRCWNRWD